MRWHSRVVDNKKTYLRAALGALAMAAILVGPCLLGPEVIVVGVLMLFIATVWRD